MQKKFTDIILILCNDLEQVSAESKAKLTVLLLNSAARLGYFFNPLLATFWATYKIIWGLFGSIGLH